MSERVRIQCLFLRHLLNLHSVSGFSLVFVWTHPIAGRYDLVSGGGGVEPQV